MLIQDVRQLETRLGLTRLRDSGVDSQDEGRTSVASHGGVLSSV